MMVEVGFANRFGLIPDKWSMEAVPMIQTSGEDILQD